MLRLTCSVTGTGIWVRPDFIMCMQQYPVDEFGPTRTLIDLDNDQYIVVRESPDQIAMILAVIAIIF